MHITIDSHDVMEAIEEWLQRKYNTNLNLGLHCICEGGVWRGEKRPNLGDIPTIDYQQYEQIHKRHKNGKVMKAKDGSWIVDEKKSGWRKGTIPFNDGAGISMFFEPKANEKD